MWLLGFFLYYYGFDFREPSLGFYALLVTCIMCDKYNFFAN